MSATLTTDADADARQAAPTEPETQPETTTDTAPGAEQTDPPETEKPESKSDARDRAIRQAFHDQRAAQRQIQQLREQLERAQPPRDPNAPPSQAELDRIIEERAAALIEKREAQAKTEAWIARGNADFPDFNERCNQLADMGAGESADFMRAIGRLDDGHKLIADLAENPAETARLLKLPAVDMALEMAKMSAKLAAAPPPAPKPTTQAPPPIRPIQTTSRAEVRLESLDGDDFLHAWNKRTKGRA